ncbi:hypothetical protein IIC65_05745, partial [Candidatus Sumerlaeota bacterium]|nr:hypothetical protein [Candidatus Sumerlaeota bacterium]
MNPPSNRSSSSNLGRADLAGLAFLALLPSLLYAPALIRGEIPLAMDPVMYFFPLRWHAAEQVLSGHLPWWNRSILGGMPLFANPQAALSYPFNWPMLLRPGALTFAFPMTLQLGLWAAFTALLLRRLGIARLSAFWAGCLCLAGNYGWSRFQYGNYLNVLPWWPVALLAAHEFAASARRGFLVIGGCAAALMILAGAHQLALYGFFALAAYLLFMAAADRTAWRRWAAFAIVSAALGVLLGATGWLAQWAFLRETARAGAIDPGAILSGAFASLAEIAQALTGLHGGGLADAESSASVGAITLVIAGLIPRRRALVLPWLGAWIMVLITVLPSWRPVTSLLLRLVPAAAVFHDPRRLLGVAQWGIILASGISLASWIEAASASPRPMHRLALRSLPAALIGAFLLVSVPWPIDSPWSWLTIAVVVLMVAFPLGALNIPQSIPRSIPQRRRALWAVSVSALAALWGLTTLGFGTWHNTDFSRVRAENLFTQSGAAPMIHAAALQSPRRFFSLDWQRSTSYDYRRPDLAAWGLPNMAMLFGVEDMGGYEPARSVRYDRWRSSFSAWPRGVQPWAAHFGLLYPRYPGLAPQLSMLADANLGA